MAQSETIPPSDAEHSPSGRGDARAPIDRGAAGRFGAVAPPPPVPSSNGGPVPGPLNVLVVDDDPLDARLVWELLRSAEPDGAGFVFTHAERLKTALWRLDTGRVDVVLLDLGLPDSQGLETFRQLHAHAPGVPVVVLSGLADEALALTAVHAGAQDYLVKGRVSTDMLPRVLRYAVERGRLLAAERAARADLQAALTARDALMASVTHDLRNPLSTMRLGAQAAEVFLGDERLPDAQRHAQARGALARMTAAALRMDGFIQELLDVAQLQTGAALPLNLWDTDLAEVARTVVEAHALAGRAVRLEVPDAPVVGMWDKPRLLRVVDNLLSNAFKYSPREREVVLAITLEGDSADEWAVLRMQDHGWGIPAADLPRLFERFFRASNVQGRVNGTGLGLWGVKQIVEQHGGTISVASEEGVGTTVTVRLPLDGPAVLLEDP